LKAGSGSENEFQDQQQRGLMACPLCADTSIQNASAPAILAGRLSWPNRTDPEAPSHSRVILCRKINGASVRQKHAVGTGLAAQAAF
jgi:hypothetical protein